MTEPSFEEKNHSNTKVHFCDYVEARWKGGKRRPMSIRQNDKLYAEFKPIAQHFYGSVCRAIESFEAAVVVAAEHEVHFSSPIKHITIDKIVIERNVRSRRVLSIPAEPEASDAIEPCCYFCGKRPVVGIFEEVNTGLRRLVCAYHAESLAKHRNWADVSNQASSRTPEAAVSSIRRTPAWG